MKKNYLNKMGGLRRICKQFGGCTLNGVEYIYDYERDDFKKKSDLSRKELERIEDYKWKLIMKKEGKLT